MLDILNRYTHGFVVTAVTLACRRRKVFDALRRSPQTLEELAIALAANAGHLSVALRLFESLGWLDRDATKRYAATSALARQTVIPDDAWQLLEADMDAYLRHGDGALLRPWLARMKQRWNCADARMADYLDGLLVVPVLAHLAKRRILRDQPARDFSDLPVGVRDEAIELFEILGWLEGKPGARRLTPPGEFMVDRAMNLALAESYRPMLGALDELLFGNAAAVFALRPDGHENHVDRTMNVLASGHMHDRYFAEVEEILVSIFSREPFSSQPRYVADMGSGDGTFLKRVYETVRDKTSRGRHLDRYPLTMIGIDLNGASLAATSRTLAEHGIEHVVVAGDIGNPQGVADSLRTLGVDPQAVLHIRSFLDHDRPYLPPADGAAVDSRSSAEYHGVYVDQRGRSIPPSAAVQSLVEHLSRWAAIVNEHGFIQLEVHCQEPRVVHEFIDHSESLYFDAIEAFSHQLLIEADAALLAAAEAGLFPRREHFRKYPGFMPYCRITLNLFERRPYRVRFARPSDVPALLRLEDACWLAELRASAQELERRIAVYPLGQLVLELDGEIVATIYSQRVGAIDALRSVRWVDVGRLHDPRGPFVQLLSLNVLPDKQQLGLGDQLLDMMLMRSALQGGVRGVVGLTRCIHFSGRSLEELSTYVAARDVNGLPLDPVLQFHHRHGANILGPVPGYRPADTANLGAGVLLHYDFSESGTALSAAAPASLPRGASSVEECLRRLLGPKRQKAFSRNRSLRDTGLDSLALLEFRTLLEQAFGQTLSPTFFFSHPTVAKIERYFAEQAVPGPEAAVPRASVVRLDRPAALQPPATTIARPAEASAAVAIVGMAARLPQAPDVASYWRLLVEGRDAIVEVPRSRWDNAEEYSADPDAPGKIVTRYGGFLERIDEFDAAFFDIAPPEARLMDPQQRLLLEVNWEALEHAGIDPRRLAETDCGFFVGMFTHDYETLIAGDANVEIGAYFATGTSASIAAGRLAYLFGTHGPALTIDTACSSSLVAVHQAIRSLRTRECDTALASGVSLILSPRLSAAFSKAGMLAPDGRCKAFSADANGYVRSEGCAAVVLKRLDDAIRDGDRVLAVLCGSAVNQDGASNGITAPNVTAQQRLLRRALEDARVGAADIDYVEAHGTGTSLGDPVEFDALKAVFGSDPRRREPLWLGSAKTNIGHAEAVAGLAGLIKVVLTLQHRKLPPHLHFSTPNPYIDLASLPAQIPTVATALRDEGPPLRAGVSSFGFSGTNAHVIVEAAPVAASPAPHTGALAVLPLSAKTEAALQALMGRYVTWLEDNPRADLADVCYTASTGRAHHARRAAVVAGTSAQLAEGLRQRLRLRVEQPVIQSPRVAFMFTGQGSQYAGMARELAQSEPVFRSALAECQLGLADELDRPLEEILFGSEAIDATELAQPALFAVEYALAKTLEAWGVKPEAVMGHSVGEYVAACIAGVFSLRDGLRLIAARGRLMGSLPRDGAMVAVLGHVPDLDAVLATEADVAVAAYNGPENVALSGRRAAVEEIGRRLEQAGAKVVPLHVSHAFHSPLMTSILPAFKEIVRWATLSPPQLPLVSNVSGTFAAGEIAKPDYWARHLREPVRFAEGVHTLFDRGVTVVVEIGPHPVLSQMAEACADARQSAPVKLVPTLRRGMPDREALAQCLAALYESGVDVDWRAVHSNGLRTKVALPTYPWQRKRHWFAEDSTDRGAPGRSPSLFAPRWLPRELLGRAAFARCSNFVPAPAELAQAAELARRTARERYPESGIATVLHRASAELVIVALSGLGHVPLVGERVSAADISTAHRLAPRHARLLHRCLEILAEDGWLERASGDHFIVRRAWAASIAPSLPSAAAAAECRAELTLLERCGSRLRDVLRGDVDPLELLFPGGGLDDALAVYTSAPFAAVGNAMAAAAIERVAAALPPGRTLRVLELGAGTGGTTAALLPGIAKSRCEYVFTDVSVAFLDAARQKFADYPFVRYELLDVERALDEQGFAPGQFDVVVATNVLHATADLRASVARAIELLSPSGSLLLVEGLGPTRWVDLVFGLTEGWWRFADAPLRTRYPLLGVAEWRELLREVGADAVEIVTTTPQHAVPSAVDLFNQGVIMARRPQGASIASNRALALKRWVLVAREGAPLARELARAAAAEHHDCHVVTDGKPLREALGELGSGGPAATIVDCRLFGGVTAAVDGIEEVDAALELGMQTVELVRAAVAAGAATTCLVTSGARSVLAGERGRAAVASLDGLANVVRTEAPAIDFRVVDFDEDAAAPDAARALLRELASAADDSHVSYRGGQRFAQRYVALPRHEPAVQVRADGVYLILGGMGDLGLHAATWLAARGARRLVLAGRTPFPPRDEWARWSGDPVMGPKIATVRALEAKGVELRFPGLDVARPEEVKQLLVQLETDGWTPVRGIVQAAAVIADQLIDDVDEASYRRVLLPKVGGMRNLVDALREQPLELVLVYSSIGAVVGLPGQASYAAANAYLDAYALDLRSQGWPITSVNWCGWDDTGLARTPGGRRAIAELELLGIRTVDGATGSEILDTLMSAGVAQAVVMPLDASRRSRADGIDARLVDVLARYRGSAPQGKVPPMAATPASPLVGLRGAALLRALEQLVTETVAGILDIDVASIDVERSLGDLGIDSLLGLEFRRVVQRKIGIVLSATLVWNYPTVRAIVAYLAARLDAPDSTAAAVAPTTAAAPSLVDLGEMTDEEALRQLAGR